MNLIYGAGIERQLAYFGTCVRQVIYAEIYKRYPFLIHTNGAGNGDVYEWCG
jgi:hypothetical protein